MGQLPEVALVGTRGVSRFGQGGRLEGSGMWEGGPTIESSQQTVARPTTASRALVTGVGGFIGSHLAEALVGQGVDVVGIDRRCPERDAAAADNLAGLISQPAFRLVVADLNDADLLPWLHGVQTVYHLAGVAGVRGSWGVRFANYVAANLLATQRVLEACVTAAVPRLILASSSSVYGQSCGRPSREGDPTRPVSPYGVTKLAAEQLALAYALRPGAPTSVVALRCFTVYGPRQRPDMAISRLLNAALTGQPVRLYGDGSQRRDFTYVSDTVAAALAAAAVNAHAKVVNVAGGRSVALHEVVRIVAAVTGQSVSVLDGVDRPGDVGQTHADLTRAAALLGYQPAVSLTEGIGRQWAWVTCPPRSARSWQAALMTSREP